MKIGPVCSLLLLASCAQLNTAADTVDTLCADILPLARSSVGFPPAATIAVYIVAACDTAEGISKLRHDPQAISWMKKVSDELRAVMRKYGRQQIS
jgi:hypothetical protein